MKHTFAKCIFTSAAFCFALVADAGQTLENSSVSVSVSENGISLLDKKSGKTFAQLPPQYKISKIIKTGETLKFDVAARPPISASITLSQRGFTLSLSADGKFQAPIKFPPAWQMQRGDIGIYPIGTGLALPVEMECPTRPNPPAIRGAAWSMSLTAFERGGTFVITAIEKPYDAQIFNTLVGGLTTLQSAGFPKRAISPTRAVCAFLSAIPSLRQSPNTAVGASLRAWSRHCAKRLKQTPL